MSKVIDNLEIIIIGTRDKGSEKTIIKYNCIDSSNKELCGPTKTIEMTMVNFMKASRGVLTPQSASAFWYAVLHATEFVEGISLTEIPLVPDWPSGSEIYVSNITQNGMILSWVSPFTVSYIHSFKIIKNGVELGIVDGNILTFEISGLQPEQMCSFKIEASEIHDGVLYWTNDGPSKAVESAP